MRLRSLPLLAIASLLFLFAGCDEADTNLFTFDVSGVTFTFSFTGSQIDGSTATVQAQSSENILSAIRDQGFGPEEVSSVKLKDGTAEIRLLNAPSGATIDVLDDVSVRISSGGASAEVASAENISGGTSMLNEADLDVSGENIAGLVTAGDIGATLDVSGDAGLPAGTYRVEVRFDVEVAVQGL